ncbi:hypothetical protein LVJ82_13165 [Vitreoscilla massiliensis]|uniref:Uncharacterized protein n=1 Tax=Vitreoscilla massiliensis TaxID=1689272 RepID=A0ABY4DZ76_9NEIS|nr:hypothetical protein [Vitreoscilla massiliensis]UOO88416.1 hypothetical protein LVJ82_13165 [Vitreoscilla massiliensis]
MGNPVRRNRNIGTKKQGHGQNNRLTIHDWCKSSSDSRAFYERLGKYRKEKHTINGHEFVFVLEETTAGFCHVCSVADVVYILSHLPASDYGELKWVIFRQPKRKEVILEPVWGRLLYSYEFEGAYFPAIILEAVDLNSSIRWRRKLVLDDQVEMQRLIADGHEFTADKRGLRANMTAKYARATQLYRTLPHELGHYVQYLQVVGPSEYPEDDAAYELAMQQEEERYEQYCQIPTAEKEKFAHRYADEFKAKLEAEHLIPFAPLV